MKTTSGRVGIGSVRYDHDVIVHRDGSVEKRSKKKSKKLRDRYGHTPPADHELAFLADEKPGVVSIGTGQYGDLPVTEESRKILKGYEAVIRPTPDVPELMGREHRPYAAILHVTC
ncbi:MAG TPA: hypothetical protein VLY83_03725 [Methanoregula sp.]|nr:hypothetical protein [Methanoregula sp.]